MTPAAVEEVFQSLDAHVRETASMLSVQVGETIDYAQLQSEAATQLAQLSMQAEMERRASTQRAAEARVEAERLDRENRSIKEQAQLDALTKIGNRAAFDQHLLAAVNRAEQEGHRLGLIMMDVDHFKQFNDTHGHQAGDEVLRTVAQCLRQTAAETGFVARYGGEEFAVILANDAAERIGDLAEQIRVAVADTPANYGGRQLSVTASFGAVVATPKQESLTPERLIEVADAQLYAAKRSGRNRVCLS